MSLRDGTKKMSKSDASDYSRINMTDDADTDRPQDPQGQDRSRALARAGGPAGPTAASIRRPRRRGRRPSTWSRIYAALSDQPLAEVLSEFAGQEFSHLQAAC